MTPPTPTVVVISGAPGCGKSTLAAHLHHELGWPSIDRDSFKAGQVHALGLTVAPAFGDETGRTSYEALFDIAARIVALGSSVIVEGALWRHTSEPPLQTLSPPAVLRSIHCVAERATCIERIRERFRTSPQLTRTFNQPQVESWIDSADFPWDRYEPLDLDAPSLHVRTENGYDPGLPEILTFIEDR